jgi:hypothetical protein
MRERPNFCLARSTCGLQRYRTDRILDSATSSTRRRIPVFKLPSLGVGRSDFPDDNTTACDLDSINAAGVQEATRLHPKWLPT